MKNLKTMMSLTSLVKPMTGWLLLAVILGTAGFAAATAIPVLAVTAAGSYLGWNSWNPSTLFALMGVCAVVRGILRYGEQACNHYVAFKLLAHIRHLVFGRLRKLAPACLEGKKSGDLIALITSDVELLEVFFAHTISPVCIALCFAAGAFAFGYSIHPLFGWIFLAGYAGASIVIPWMISRKTIPAGEKFRQQAGELSSDVFEAARGMKELIQFQACPRFIKKIAEKTDRLAVLEKDLKVSLSKASTYSSACMTLCALAILFAGQSLLASGQATPAQVLTAFVFALSSFGPFFALSALSATLAQTMGSAKRVLELLDKQPEVKENMTGREMNFTHAEANGISFAYADGEQVLDNFSCEVKKGEMIGISGASGCGKSTLLRLMMRFWDVQEGSISFAGDDIKSLSTQSLRNSQSYVIQDTVLFASSVADNLRIAKADASMEEIEQACKMANIHQRILELPDGYDTVLEADGASLSAGERQRLGLARAFLHDGDMMLLDEPTSNLDVLNEGAVLKALHENRKNKTVILVSHRQKTLEFADRMIFMKPAGRSA